MSYDRDRDNSSRIYVGNLPVGVDQREVEAEFSNFGRLLRCDIKRTTSGNPFAFIEFHDPRDAADAIQERDGWQFGNSRLRVEIPFNARDGDRAPRRGRGGPPRKGRFVVEVRGLPPSGSWQDLKDHMREAGELGHADVFRDGTGEVSFFNERDMRFAVEKFDNSTFRSHEGEKSVVEVREKFVDFDGDRAGGYMGRRRSRSPPSRGGGRRSRSRSRDPYDRRGMSGDRRGPSGERGPPARMGGPPGGMYGRERSYDRRSPDRYDKRGAGGRGRSNERGGSRSRSPGTGGAADTRRSPYGAPQDRRSPHGPDVRRGGSPGPYSGSQGGGRARSPPIAGGPEGGRSPYMPADRRSPYHDRRGGGGPPGYSDRYR